MKDKIVDPDGSVLLFEALGGKTRRAKLKLTKFEDQGHTIWSAAYRTPELFGWLLRQRKTKPPLGDSEQLRLDLKKLAKCHFRNVLEDKCIIRYYKTIRYFKSK